MLIDWLVTALIVNCLHTSIVISYVWCLAPATAVSLGDAIGVTRLLNGNGVPERLSSRVKAAA